MWTVKTDGVRNLRIVVLAGMFCGVCTCAKAQWSASGESNVFDLSLPWTASYYVGESNVFSLVDGSAPHTASAGVTVITHGWALTGGPGSNPPGWTVAMAHAILDRAGGGSIFIHNQETGEWQSLADFAEARDTTLAALGYEPYTNPTTGATDKEIVLVYNWTWESNDLDDGWLQAAADSLFAALMQPPAALDYQGCLLLDKPLHLIGHSRGAVLNLETAKRIWSVFGRRVCIDHFTSLDPHPQEQTNDPGLDPVTPSNSTIHLTENINYADNFFRRDGAYQVVRSDLGDFNGVPAIGASNGTSGTGVELDEDTLVGEGYLYEHSDVHLWYHGTIDTEGGFSDGDETLSEGDAAGWYPKDSDMGPRDGVGFACSLIGGQRPAQFPTSGRTDDMSPWTAELVCNGNFDYAAISVSEIPGWERHGGGGNATLREEDGNKFLALTLESFFGAPTSRSHSPMYLPPNADAISFDYRVYEDDQGTAPNVDQFQVLVDDQMVFSEYVTQETASFVRTVCDLPQSLRGKVATLTFKLVDQDGEGWLLNSEVWVDNISLVVTDPVYAAPTFVSTPVAEAVVGSAYAYVVRVADADTPLGDLAIVAVSKPDWLILVDNGDGSATLSGTPTVDAAPGQTVQLAVSDHDGQFGTQEFLLTVSVPNAPPTVSEIAVAPSSEGQTASLTATLSDDDSNILHVAIDWGDGTAVETTDDQPVGQFARSHVYADDSGAGTYAVSITVTDGEGAETVATTSAAVANVAPASLALSPLSATEGVDYEGALSATDVASDALTWTKTGGAACLSVTGSGAVTGTPTNDDTGEQELAVSVDDGDGGVTAASFTIVVAPRNDAPAITEASVTAATEGTESTLTARLNDIDDTVLDVEVDWGDGTAVESFPGQPLGVFTATHTYADNGTDGSYTVILRATDAHDALTSVTIDATVTNVPPTELALTPPMATQGQAYEGTLSATDVAADPLTWTKTGGADWLAVAEDGTVTGTPGADDTGEQVLQVSVADGDSGTATAAFTIVVTRTDSLVFYVDQTAVGGAGNGSSWPDAFLNLQPALDATQPGDEVWVASGTYLPSDDGDRGRSFVLADGVDVYGGFAGGETSREDRDWRRHATTLSGDLAGNDDGAVTCEQATRQDNAYHVVLGANAARLDGFRIIGGNANGGNPGGNDLGGGMLNLAVSPVVTNCLFEENTAAQTGGAVANTDSSVSITSCRFANNYAQHDGGAVINVGGAPELVNAVMHSNRAGQYGAAIANVGGTVTITNCTLFGNEASVAGGGVSSGGGATTIANSIMWSNTAPGDPCLRSSEGADVVVSYSCTDTAQPGTGNTTESPFFSNAEDGDLRLLVGSSCIDSGTVVGAPSADIDGMPRDAAPDIGAYEGAYARLTIASQQPYGEVSVTVQPLDADGMGVGQTPFSRIYLAGTETTLSAPSVTDNAQFMRWLSDDAVVGTTAAQTLTLTEVQTITAVYDTPPSVADLVIAPTPEGTESSLFATLGDVDDPVVTVSIDWGDGGETEAVDDAPVGAFQCGHTYADDGEYTIVVTVSDGQLDASATTSVSVANMAPSALALVPLAGTEDVAYVGILTATDVDELTWTKTGGAGWLSVTPDGRVSGTPTNADTGSQQLEVSVSDGDSGVAAASFTIQVAAVNDAPTIGSLAATPGPEGTASTLNATCGDVDSQTLTVILDWGDGSTAEVVSNVLLGAFQRQHVYANDGTYTITVTVSDGDLDTGDTVSVTVPNAVPADLNLTPLTATEDQPYVGTLSAIDGDDLTWSKTGGASWLSVAPDGRVTGTPTNADTGSQQLAVSVADGDGGVQTATFTIQVTPVNDAPTITDLAADTGDEGMPTTLTATLGDVDTPALTVAIDWGDGTTSEQLTGVPVGAFERRHTYANDGDYTIGITVGDGQLEASETTSVSVPNAAPSALTLVPLTGTEDVAYAGTLSATDVDELTWSKTGGASWLSVAPDGRVTGTPTNADTGSQALDVSVSDGDGGVTTASFSIVIGAANDAPTVADLAVTPAPEGAESTLAATIGDVDNLVLTVTIDWGEGDDPESIEDVPVGEFRRGHVYIASGQFTVVLTISDGELQDSNTTQFTIANVPPTDLVLAPLTGLQDRAYAGSLAATDVDGLTWTKTGGADWLSVDPSGTVTGIPGPEDTGDQILDVTVEDTDGAVCAARFTIVVRAVLACEFGAGYVLIGLPLTDTGLDAATDVIAWAPNAQAVYQYDVSAQTWQVYSAGVGGPNFSLTPGSACFVTCDAPYTNANLVGLWGAAQQALATGHNLMCLPKSQQDITSASALLAAIPGAQAVWSWDIDAQAWRSYVAGFGGVNFPVAPGTPFMVAVDAPTTWPPSED